MAPVLYLKGLEIALRAVLNIATAPVGTVKLAYMTVAFTPNAGTQQFFSDISASVAAGAPTETLTGLTVTIDTVNARVEVDATDVTEPNITTITNKFVLYVDTGVASTSPLIGCFAIVEGTLSPIAGTLALAFNAEGIFALNDN